MLGREAEVAAEAEPLGLDPVAALRRSLLHRLPHARVQVADELLEDLLLGREVEVERPLRDPGRLGDLDDRRVVEAELREDLLRRVEQPAAGLEPLRLERAAVRSGQRHASTRSSSFSTLFMPERGSASTNRTSFGTLKRASRARQWATRSSSVAGSRRTTNARQTSPQRSSAFPTTAASTTAGCSWRTASTSAG